MNEEYKMDKDQKIREPMFERIDEILVIEDGDTDVYKKMRETRLGKWLMAAITGTPM